MKVIDPVAELKVLQGTRQQQEMAEVFGISSAFMSMVMLGKKPPTKIMLAAIGLVRIVERRVVYVKVKP